MGRRISKLWLLVGGGVFFVAMLTGCRIVKVDENKVKDLEYTVCDESRLPKELVTIIDKQKEEPFKLTYRTKDFLYIVVGYGKQNRTDLGVAMTKLYLTGNTIFVDTELVSTKEETKLGDVITYPYIAVKCPNYPEEVQFR